MADIEAVQFGEWKPWHAVRRNTRGESGDRTFCGLNAIKAIRMYVPWPTIPSGDRCRRCQHMTEGDT